MHKLKTIKSISKRIKITPNQKMIQRSCGQNHFNARENGSITRNKRRDHAVSFTHRKAIRIALPYLF